LGPLALALAWSVARKPQTGRWVQLSRTHGVPE
jgi:hypothetical protein